MLEPSKAVNDSTVSSDHLSAVQHEHKDVAAEQPAEQNLIWNARSQYDGVKFHEDLYRPCVLSSSSKHFLNTLLNLVMFRRMSAQFFSQYLDAELSAEFTAKVGRYVKKYGPSWKDSMYYFTIYGFSDKLGGVLLSQINVLCGALLVMHLLPTQNDSLQREIKDFLGVSPKVLDLVKILSFDIGCSSQAKSDLCYIYSNHQEVDLDVSQMMTIDQLMLTVRSTYDLFRRFVSIIGDTIALNAQDKEQFAEIKARQNTFYEFGGTISEKVCLHLLLDYVCPKVIRETLR